MSSDDWHTFRSYMRGHPYPALDRSAAFQIETHAQSLLAEVATAQTAWSAMLAALSTLDIESIGTTWYHLDVLLGAAFRVTHILWPVQGYRRRGKLLRQHFAIPDDSPITQRGVRNGFEHFDERVDDYLNTGTFTVVDRMIGPATAIEVDGAAPQYLRRLDPATMTTWFLDESLELQTLVAALVALPVQMYGVTQSLDLLLYSRSVRRS
jgi:hypothetical protein